MAVKNYCPCSHTFLLIYDSRFLQQIVANVTTDWVTLEIKGDVHVFAKSAGIIVPVRLSITKCFHNLIGSYQHVRHSENSKVSTWIKFDYIHKCHAIRNWLMTPCEL